MIARYWLLGGMCGAVDVREKKNILPTPADACMAQ